MFGDVDELNLAAYWSQKLSVSKNLDITGGLRLDYFTNKYDDRLAFKVLKSNSTLISPKLNFNLRVNDNVPWAFYPVPAAER